MLALAKNLQSMYSNFSMFSLLSRKVLLWLDAVYARVESSAQRIAYTCTIPNRLALVSLNSERVNGALWCTVTGSFIYTEYQQPTASWIT